MRMGPKGKGEEEPGDRGDRDMASQEYNTEAGNRQRYIHSSPHIDKWKWSVARLRTRILTRTNAPRSSARNGRRCSPEKGRGSMARTRSWRRSSCSRKVQFAYGLGSGRGTSGVGALV